MKQIHILGIATLAIAWLAQPAAWPQEGQQLGQFRVPEYDENGVKKSNLTGETAVVRPDGNVDIRNFRMEFFEPDGVTLRMTVTAPICNYSQALRVAKSDTAVRIEGAKMVVTGEDFAWDGERELFKIFKNTKVVLKGGGAALAARTGETDQAEE
jgi:hypothetical protein